MPTAPRSKGRSVRAAGPPGELGLEPGGPAASPAAAQGGEANRAPPRGALLRRIAEGYFGASIFVVLELVVVAWLERRALGSSGDLSIALRTLLPIAVAAALPAAVLGASFAHAVSESHRRMPRTLAALGAAAFAAATAYGVSTGRHLAGARRPVFVLLVALLAAAAVLALAPRLARWLRGAAPRARAGAVLLGVVALVVALEITNQRVLPRLYPAFHHALALAALGVSAAIGLARPPSAGGALYTRVVSSLALVVFALAVALTPRAAGGAASADNVRVLYTEHAPVLARAVELAALIEPPEPLDEAPVDPVLVSGEGVDLRGWDLLLITVDALRPDHLGAYGYGRPTSPRIDALATEGLVFDAAYTPTPHTSYAVTSLMTGKYMRPLLSLGLGADSETWAGLLRRYGYKTGAFYPPAIFFIDGDRFERFARERLGFEYVKEEFLDARARVAQVERFLGELEPSQPTFTWVHLFEPHEPYEQRPELGLGERDVDRYDAEIAYVDRAIGELVDTVRARRPRTIVVVTADHGEEFGEHGGRYHGSTVYEEQVRVPLVVHAPGLVRAGRVPAPVGLVDLLPTVLEGLKVPKPPRVRGRDLGPWLASAQPGEGFAFAEADAMAMIAEGSHRLVCMRRAGACSLYDVSSDPEQRRDVSGRDPERVERLRASLRRLDASHGRYELSGLRSEGHALPEALRRGIGGDGDAAPDVAALLDDADVVIRRRAAEVLFELRRKEVTPQLRLAVARDEDPTVRAYASLALTRLGEGSPLSFELLFGPEVRLRRLAALALAEAGDPRGEEELVRWWRLGFPRSGAPPSERDALPFERAREVLEALATIRARTAVGPLVESLDDVRLRPHIARTLARIGEEVARPALTERLAEERYQPARVAITEALLDLGAGPEMRAPLVTLLGVPDPLPFGLEAAERAGVLRFVGGPTRDAELARLRRFATSGVSVDFVVPETKVELRGVRAICRATAPKGGQIRLGSRKDLPLGPERKAPVPARQPVLDPERSVVLELAPSEQAQEVHARLPDAVGAKPKRQIALVVYATQGVSVDACALVPMRDEIVAPRPRGGAAVGGGGAGD